MSTLCREWWHRLPRCPRCRDTAGQERYQTITKQYYRRAQVRGCVQEKGN